MELKEDSLVLCAVKKIEGTTVFVEIESNGQGTILMSEIAAGRIRNLRQYVVPNKKIVCKVLKISKGNIELSLRRVTAKEREEVMDTYKKERNLLSMLKAITKQPEKIFEKIKTEHSIPSFLDEAKLNPKLLENFLSKTEAEKLANSIKEKQEKEKIIKKTISLSSTSPLGLQDIKNILKTDKLKINYLGSSKFLLQAKAQTFKEAESLMKQEIEEIEKKAKQKHALFSTKDKK